MLTPENFRTDLNEDDLLDLRCEIKIDRAHSRILQLTMSSGDKECLRRGELVALEVGGRAVLGRFEVLTVESSLLGNRYTLAQAWGPTEGTETLIRVEGESFGLPLA